MICSSLNDLQNISISFGKPKRIRDRTYACRIVSNNEHIYSQTPICVMDGGVLSIADKKQADLKLHKTNEYIQFIDEFIKNILGNVSSDLIDVLYHKDLSLEERLTLLHPLYTSSGDENVNLTAHISTNTYGTPNTIFYSHDSEQLDFDDIDAAQSNGNIMVILHFKEIIFTPEYIKIVVFANQIMCLEEPQIQQKSLFSLPSAIVSNVTQEKQKDDEEIKEGDEEREEEEDNIVNSENVSLSMNDDDDLIGDIQVDVSNIQIHIPDSVEDASKSLVDSNVEDTKIQEKPIEDTQQSSQDIIPVELKFDELEKDDTVEVTDKKKVYRDLYHNALKEAKIHQQNALRAYLEAKRIKNEYFEDDSDIESLLSYSDSDEEDEDDESDDEHTNALTDDEDDDSEDEDSEDDDDE